MAFSQKMSNRRHKKSIKHGSDKSTKFISAALRGNQATMNKLLAAGHDINQCNEVGETAFSWCCQSNQLKSAMFLFKKGANVNIELTGGATPLDVAVCWSSPSFRSWLKSVGGLRNKSYEEANWPRYPKFKTL